MLEMLEILSCLVSQYCLPPPGISLSGFNGRMKKPGRPGGELPLSIITVFDSQQNKPHKKYSTDSDNFGKFDKNAEKHNDNS